jgi:hypothetical protein
VDVSSSRTPRVRRRQTAEARDERTLSAVACMPLFGQVVAPDPVMVRWYRPPVLHGQYLACPDAPAGDARALALLAPATSSLPDRLGRLYLAREQIVAV